MNAERLLAHYARIADTSEAIARLRRFILDLAVRGKLVPQDPKDEAASELLKRLKTQPSHSSQKASRTDKNEATASEYDLPSNWLWVRIGDHLELINGMAFKPTDWQQTGIKIVRIQNLNRLDAPFNYCNSKRIRDRFLIDDGAFLISWSGTPGTSFGAFVWDRGPAVLNQHIFRCDFRLNAFHAQYLRLAINGRLDEMIAKAHGGVGLQHITKGKLEALLIALPPLAEQHRIVAKVDELMALCDQLEAARAKREVTRDRLTAASLARLNAPDPDRAIFVIHAHSALDALPALTTRPDQIKQIRQSMLNLAVRGKLVPHDANDEPASEQLKRLLVHRRERWDAEQTAKFRESVKTPARGWKEKYVSPTRESGLFDVPTCWTWASSSEVCERIENGSTPPAIDMSEGAGEVPFIKVYNLTKNGTLDFTNKPTFIPRAIHEGRLARSKVLPGDVLMNIVGPPLGKVSIVPSDFPEWNTNQAVVLFRPSGGILTRYLATCLLADAVLFWITRTAQATVGQSNVTVSSSRVLPIPLPPLAEQRRIVAKVDELMALLDRLEATLDAIGTTRRRLLEALLHEALDPLANALEAAE